MKIIEEQNLQNAILQLNTYQKKFEKISEFYHNLDTLEIPSLQNLSFEKDNEFFDEVSLILSVIASIIAKPHLSNKGEDIILRAEQAGHLSNESFQKVLKDSSLWKEKSLEMVPEYVHHYQYTDDIKIYENLFIGMLVNLIDEELIKYYNFYLNLVPSIDLNNDYSLLDTKNAEEALKKLDRLNRKIRYIKNTYFYKEVSTANLHFKNVQPTNILVKDLLYNKCFKFYRKFIKYNDDESLLEDFKSYYYYLILKVFKQRNLKFNIRKTKNFNYLYFYDSDYWYELSKDENKNYLTLKITLKSNPNASGTHVLLLDTGRKISNEKNIENATTVNTITLWNLYENLTPYFKNILKEEEITNYWIDLKLKVVDANTNFYEHFCPVCKNRNVRSVNDVYYCSDCKSIYSFKGNDKIWLIKLTRR